jgi:septum formation protein
MSISRRNIILGSQSPRRRELLGGLDIPFTVVSIEADESYPENLQRGEIPYFISRAKADAYAPSLRQDDLLITADTIVWAEGRMLGKPHSEAEAVEMLRLLSNKTHQVYTAVTFARLSSSSLVLDTVVDQTDVTFAPLTDEEIARYVSRYRPFDKAGAYGIQEWIGYIACTAMNGSYFNVMGLPVHKVYEYLKQIGYEER